ncbi:hypothetical protein G6F62_015264 [Rhizopus arrhizus]|nr:hypothetical protein G6F62_015264 [Rhizopus arrhizus]
MCRHVHLAADVHVGVVDQRAGARAHLVDADRCAHGHRAAGGHRHAAGHGDERIVLGRLHRQRRGVDGAARRHRAIAGPASDW